MERVVRETGERLDNGLTEIYVNAQVKDSTATSELMTIFTEGNAYDDEKFPATSKRKRYFKEDQKGVREMCEIMQEIKEEGRIEGRIEGHAAGRMEMLVQMYRDERVSLAEACVYLQVTEEEFLEELKKYNKVV